MKVRSLVAGVATALLAVAWVSGAAARSARKLTLRLRRPLSPPMQAFRPSPRLARRSAPRRQKASRS